MHSRGIDCNSLFSADVRTVFEVTMLALLLGLEVQTSETTQILLDDSFIDGRATADTLSVIVGNSVEGMRLSALRKE